MMHCRRIHSRLPGWAGLFFCAIWLTAGFAHAANDGMPDVSFGTDGRLLVAGTERFFPFGAVLDTEGNLLLAGITTKMAGPVPLPEPDQAAVVRLTPEGVVDTTFGDAGWARLPEIASLNLSAYQHVRFTSLLPRPAGGWFVLGTIDGYSTGYRNCTLVMSMSEAGIFDPDFGTDGAVCVGPTSSNHDVIQSRPRRAPAAAMAGTTLFLSTPFTEASPGPDTSANKVYAVDQNGSTVSSFANNGVLELPLVPLLPAVPIFFIASDSNGHLLAGNTTGIVRFSTIGGIDESYGNDGVSYLALYGDWFRVNSYAARVVSSGKLIAAGSIGFYWSIAEAQTLSFVRFGRMADGSPDTAAAGVLPPMPGVSPWPSVADSSGWGTNVGLTILEGAAVVQSSGYTVMAGRELVRLTPHGALDSRFGNGGYADTQWNLPSMQQVVADESHGRLWLVRKPQSYPYSDALVELARFHIADLFCDDFE